MQKLQLIKRKMSKPWLIKRRQSNGTIADEEEDVETKDEEEDVESVADKKRYTYLRTIADEEENAKIG